MLPRFLQMALIRHYITMPPTQITEHRHPEKEKGAFDLGVPGFRHSFNRLLPCFVSATTALLML